MLYLKGVPHPIGLIDWNFEPKLQPDIKGHHTVLTRTWNLPEPAHFLHPLRDTYKLLLQINTMGSKTRLPSANVSSNEAGSKSLTSCSSLTWLGSQRTPQMQQTSESLRLRIISVVVRVLLVEVISLIHSPRTSCPSRS